MKGDCRFFQYIIHVNMDIISSTHGCQQREQGAPGHVRRSDSPWASPLHVVPRSDRLPAVWRLPPSQRLHHPRPVSSPSYPGFFGPAGWTGGVL